MDDFRFLACSVSWGSLLYFSFAHVTQKGTVTDLMCSCEPFLPFAGCVLKQVASKQLLANGIRVLTDTP